MTTTLETTRAAAVRLAEQGFRVFPLVPLGKTPAVEHPFQVATSDPARADRMWAPVLGAPDERNVGLATGDGLLVVDVDMKPGQDGARSLFALDMQGLVPETRTVRTPSGGLHLYYQVPAGCRVANSVSKLAPNVDVRAENGYVVAPGSVTEKGVYVLEHDLPIADAPVELIERCGRARERAADVTPLVDLDTPGAISRAVEWLKNDAEPSFKGSGGDRAAYAAACGVRDFGISELMCLELMLDHWNERGSPQWQPERLAVKVANAFTYALNPAGSASADAEFGALPPEDESAAGIPATAKAPRFQLLSFEDSAALWREAAGEPLVEDLLDRGAMSVIYGASNEGKTFVMLDIAHAVSTGRRWNGKAVKRGPVVYIVAEGGKQIHKRTAALARRHGAEGAMFDLIVSPVNLLRAEADLKDLIAAVHAAEAKHGASAELIVVDTLSRALAGGDENSSVDMGALVKNLDRLRAATGAHLAVVHHTGKDAAKGARGHSLLRAATDTELEVAGGRLAAKKQRDMPGRFDMAFSLEDVELGCDAAERRVSSAVVSWKAETEFGDLPLTGAEADARASFAEVRTAIAEAVGAPANAEFTADTAAIIAVLTADRPGCPAKSERSAYRLLDTWAGSKLVEKLKRGQYLMALLPFCQGTAGELPT